MPKMLRVLVPEALARRLDSMRDARSDMPTASAIVRESILRSVEEFERSCVKQETEARQRAILAARVERLKPRKPRGPTVRPPWVDPPSLPPT